MRNGIPLLFFVYLQLLTKISGYAQPTFKNLIEGGSSLSTNIIQLDSGYLFGDYGRGSIIVQLDSIGTINNNIFFTILIPRFQEADRVHSPSF